MDGERDSVLTYELLRLVNHALAETRLSSLDAEYISRYYPAEPLPVTTVDAILAEVLRRDTNRDQTSTRAS